MVDLSDEPHSVAVKTRTLTKLPRHSTIHLKIVAQAKISFWFHLVDQMANGMWNTDHLVCKWARCLPSVCLLEADERVWALWERTCIKPFYWLWASDTCNCGVECACTVEWELGWHDWNPSRLTHWCLWTGGKRKLLVHLVMIILS